MYHKKVHIHFIGIGGIGMSGIAKILRSQGYTISGCDLYLDKNNIKDLQQLGCTIHEGNNTPACQQNDIDIIVYTSAVQPNNPEIIAAQQRGIPTIKRALMLAELMRTKYSIAIAGSHGKTTTTSLIAHILLQAHKDPTVIIGGHLKTISTNAQLGKGDFLVAETDESDRSLLHLQATLAVVTNINFEHAETYKNIADVKKTFLQFLNNLPFYGKAIVCLDDPNIKSLLPKLHHVKLISYGLESGARWSATHITLHPDYSTFNVVYDNQTLGSVTFTMPGRHNILNSLAAIAVAHDLDIPFATIQHALQNFGGVERRFTFRGIYKGAEIFDDYGHHPEEIRNTLLIARARAKKKLIVIFQPHRYTRTHKLWNNFIYMFLHSKIDHLIITDIYPAFEQPIPEITSQNLVRAILSKKPLFNVEYISFNPLENFLNPLENKAGFGDLILLQGAGKINTLGQYLISQKGFISEKSLTINL